MENAHIYENARQQVCIKADVCTKIDGGIEISKYVQAVSRAMGVKLRQAHGTVSIISDERTSIVLYEENQFYALSVATKRRPALRQMATVAACFSWMMACIMYVYPMAWARASRRRPRARWWWICLKSFWRPALAGKCPKADELCHGHIGG